MLRVHSDATITAVVVVATLPLQPLQLLLVSSSLQLLQSPASQPSLRSPTRCCIAAVTAISAVIVS
jgi:hypothetical protein